MSNQKNEKVRSGAGTPKRTMDGAPGREAFNQNYFKTKREACQVASLLYTGRENALPGKYLADILGLRDLRMLTTIIERERRSGVPICASCDAAAPGYYLPASADELRRYTRSLSRRIREVRSTLVCLEDALADLEAQELIWGW